MALIDSFGRHIDYLRISITDHCNLNCCYCMPVFSGRPHLDQIEILTYEEMYRLAEAAVCAGISKIRITGGEPLVRNGVVDFCTMLGNLPGLENLSLTTNGVHLPKMARSLKKAGVKRVNVSLDTLQRNRFETITGRDRLDDVLEGIRQADAAGFYPVKINVVVMRGVNDDEIAQLAALTYERSCHVRFIELMPFQNRDCGDYQDLYLPIREIIKQIPHINQAHVGPALETSGPARLCTLPGAKGKVGFIAPMSWHFCGSCNRLRLTADGNIRTCLFSETEIDVKTPLRTGATKRELIKLLRDAVKAKPRRHHLDRSVRRNHQRRAMHAIGG
jgi:GTP 3',8-cyclase